MTTYPEYLIRILLQKRVAYIAICIVAILSYANIFANTFAWDDRDTILNWQETRTWESVPAMLLGATPPGHPGNYRPVRNILYIAAYKVWGVNPWGYHLQTIMLISAISLLVYEITAFLYPKKLAPLITALLFATHPMHVEALTWMTSMMDMYGMLFGFGAVYSFLCWRKNARQLLWYLLAWCLTFLAIFTNEITLAIPLLFGLIMFIFPLPKQRFILPLLPFISIIFINAWVRVTILHIGARFTYIGGSLYTTIVVMLQAFLTYLRILFIPTNLTINHDLGNGLSSWAIELIDPASMGYKAVSSLSITTPSVLLSLTIILVLIGSALFFRRKYPLYAFGILWFFISMVPVSNLIPTEAVLTERYAFLASYGFLLLFGSLLTRITTKYPLSHPVSTVAWISVCCILIAYMTMTIQRNSEWRSDKTLWLDATQKNPNAFIAHISHANNLYSQNDIDGALQSYLSAHEINPAREEVSMYIAAMYHTLGKSQESIIYLQRILRKNPWNIEAYFRLGNLYYKNLEQYDNAVNTYLTALKIAPNHTQILNNLGVVYSIQGEKDKAIAAYTTALTIDPTYESARLNLKKISSDDETNVYEVSDPDLTPSYPSRNPL